MKPGHSDMSAAAPAETPLLGRTLRLLAPQRRLLSVAVALLVASTLCALCGPLILRHAIDHGLRAGAPDLGVITRSAALYLGAALLGLALTNAHTRLTGIVGERFVQSLRNRVFGHLMEMSSRYFDRHATGKLVSRLTSDIDALQDLVQLGVVQFVQSVLTLSLLAVVLSALSWQLTLVSLLPMPLLALATRVFQRRSREAYLEVRDCVGRTMSTLIESLSGVKVVQAFGQEAPRTARFLAQNTAQLDANIAAVRLQAEYLPLVELSTALSTALALGGGGWLVIHDQASLGTVSAFTLYLLMAFDPVQSLSFLFNTLQSAAAALHKLYALLDEAPDLVGGTGTLATPGALVLDRVSYRYGPDSPDVLRQVSLRLEAGERLALVGPTGGGKSTLAKLMARLYDPSTGSVRYGPVDLRDASAGSLRRHIVMAAQDSHLFQGSIADNLRAIRPDASDAQLEAALDRVGARARFVARPGGLAAPVGERGALLSAGERQLLALARLALIEAEVLILDEPTSSLDPGTEALVNAALENLMHGRSVVLIAHRLATMRQMDRIAVVADGGIREIGTHDELIALGGHYARLYGGWQQAEVHAVPASPGADRPGTAFANATP